MRLHDARGNCSFSCNLPCISCVILWVLLAGLPRAYGRGHNVIIFSRGWSGEENSAAELRFADEREASRALQSRIWRTRDDTRTVKGAERLVRCSAIRPFSRLFGEMCHSNVANCCDYIDSPVQLRQLSVIASHIQKRIFTDEKKRKDVFRKEHFRRDL